VQECADLLIAGAVANQQRPSTIESKKTILRLHIIPALGAHSPVIAVTDAAVANLKLRLRHKSPKTVNNTLAVLSVMLNTALEHQLIEQLPCTIRLIPVPKREPRFHDFEPSRRLLVDALAIDQRTYLIVLLGGQAGLRASEIVGLQWQDIDWTRGQICVRHSAHREELLPPKNRRVRFIPMTNDLRQALQGYPRHVRSARVLWKDDGSPLTRQGAWSRVRYAAHRAGVPTGAHVLRHTFGSHLTMRGAVQRATQTLMGHQSLTMTERYSHLSPSALNGAIGLLDRDRRTPSVGEIVETQSKTGTGSE